MINLFLRAVLVVAAATIFNLVVIRLFLDSPSDAVSLRLLRGHAVFHARAIAATPPAERRSKAAEISKALGYPVQLEEAAGRPEPRAEWRSGKIFIVAGVPQTLGQIVLGPIPYGRVSELSKAIALAIVIAIMVTLLAIRPIFRRIRSYEAVAAKMCAGDFNARAERKQGDALDGIGASLNQLADRIGQLLSDERDLLRTVAHEVRAPISRMRFRVEKIHRTVDEASKKDSSGLIADLEQVDNLFEELLTYVAFDEFDRERPELQMMTIDVTEAVSRVVKEVTATEEIITVEISGGENATVIANLKLFERAVTNLLLNAIAYGGPAIHIEVREFEQEVVVDVQDSGPGVPELDRPKVIKPFVRLSKKKTRGTGLGLAIVSRIMRLHEGRLHILDAPKGGASFQLVWKNAIPKARPKWRLDFTRNPT